ncbi:MAG TPA: hypothetical protein VND65_20490 [Candidatus Binatia bacterium]|nr:hypothetical protein [Candidatus Binatia bacterium]
MPRVAQSRKRCSISDGLNCQLSAYAHVASAAGVSVLALAGASQAKIVYTETNQATHAGVPLTLDLNHDGVKDFILRTMFYRGSSGLEIGLAASGYRNANNMVAGKRVSSGSNYFFSAASALRAGALIGPKGNFSVPSPLMAAELFPKAGGSEYSAIGAWAGEGSGVNNRYLGFKFVVNGEVHYGWARVSVTLGHHRQFDDVSGTLTGYAYETVSGKPIVAGRTTGPDVITVQPGTLGGLALGK